MHQIAYDVINALETSRDSIAATAVGLGDSVTNLVSSAQSLAGDVLSLESEVATFQTSAQADGRRGHWRDGVGLGGLDGPGRGGHARHERPDRARGTVATVTDSATRAAVPRVFIDTPQFYAVPTANGFVIKANLANALGPQTFTVGYWAPGGP